MRWMWLWAGVLWGCAPALGPRTADVLPPGQIGGNVSLVPWAYTQAAVDLREGDAPPVRFEGNGAYRMERELDPLFAIVYLYGWTAEYGLQIGLPLHLELGGSIGWGRTGLELRHGLLDEDRGAPLSLAPALSGSVQNWRKGGPSGRVGFDASRRLGSVDKGRWLTALGGLHLSTDERTANVALGKTWGRRLTCTEGWPGTPCASRDPRTRGYVDHTSFTTQLAVPFGLAYQDVTSRGRLRTVSLGAVAQVPLSARSEGSRCTNCRAEVSAGPVEVGPGLHLVLGFRIGRLDGPSEPSRATPPGQAGP